MAEGCAAERGARPHPLSFIWGVRREGRPPNRWTSIWAGKRGAARPCPSRECQVSTHPCASPIQTRGRRFYAAERRENPPGFERPSSRQQKNYIGDAARAHWGLSHRSSSGPCPLELLLLGNGCGEPYERTADRQQTGEWATRLDGLRCPIATSTEQPESPAWRCESSRAAVSVARQVASDSGAEEQTILSKQGE